ncbi:transposase [Nocardia sp. SYP-A9097]|uniref:transposase n=1 Tax=Nocardia sp. SYP-A9097 TaxID=2663237 RepID=UPI0035C8BCEF
MSLPVTCGTGDAFAELSRMWGELYACLTARGDELFELTEAVLCAQGAVRSIPELTLSPEHRLGHGALYDGLNEGWIDICRLRNLLAVDVSAWLRSDAACSPDRLFCHVYGRVKSASQFIPGWPNSFVAVLGSGATSWTQILDAGRLGPADDAALVTATQLRGVVERLIAGVPLRRPTIVAVAHGYHDHLPGLDPPQTPHPGGRRPLDLAVIAAHTQVRLARPLAADLRHRWEKPRRPAPAHPGQSPSRVPEPTCSPRMPGRRTQTHPARPGTTTRPPKPLPRNSLRRRQDRQTTHRSLPTRPSWLKNKLRSSTGTCRWWGRSGRR